MCLLQVSVASNNYLVNMSVKSAYNCISDSLARHAGIMSRAEFEADMSEMKSNKCSRSRIHNNHHHVSTNNNNNNNNNHQHGQKRRSWKGDERPCRGRRKSGGNEKPRGTNSDKKSSSQDENMVGATVVDVVDASCLERIPRLPSESSTLALPSDAKRVHFDEENLVEVTVFPDDEESADMRKCYWEIFARDRSRFKDRISQAEGDLKKVLGSDHRQRIYNQRFLSSFET